MNKSGVYIYEFGAFRLDLVRRELRCEGELVAITPKVFDTLRVLVQNQGQIVTKDALMEEIWAESFVEESGLMRNISVLRKTLGEQHQAAPFIVTVTGKGYRFLADVREVSGSIESDSAGANSPPALPDVEQQSEFHSLAVLPFKSFGGDDNAYLGLGMADALITRLSNLERLRVRPTGAVVKYGGIEQNPLDAAKDLRVESVIEGTIRQHGNRLRVTVQLVSVKNEITLWAEKFDESFTDIFAVQDLISERVAAALQVRLTNAELENLTRRATENLTAYQLYLRAFYQLNHISEKGTAQAMAYLERAIEADPNYALAYTALFSCFVLIGLFNTLPAAAIADKARGLAAKALELDETLPAAHYSQAFSHLLFDWDFAAADRSHLRAVQLNPNDAEVHRYYSFYLFLMRRDDEAVREAEIALERHPLTHTVMLQLAHAYYYSRRYEESIHVYRSCLEPEPDFLLAQLGLARSYTEKAMFRDAFAVIDMIHPAIKNSPRLISARAYISAKSGETEAAHRAIEKLLEMSSQGYVSPFDIAIIFAGLNDVEQALLWLEKAYDERSVLMPFLKADPYFDAVRFDSRFDDLLRRIGFEDIRL